MGAGASVRVICRLAEELVSVLPLFAVLVLSLSFHEAAHAWAADRLGDPTARLLGRLTLNPLSHIDWIGTVAFPLIALLTGFPLIGWAKPVPVSWVNLRSPRRDFALVALAGPVSNLLIAGVAYAVVATFWTVGVGFALALAGVVALNLMLAAFNMLPIPPLDGSNVLAGFVPEPVARGLDALRPWGFLLVYAVVLYTPVFSYIYVSKYDVIGWFS